MRQFAERLRDILEAITKLEAEACKGREAFDESQLIQVWMVHHLMVIGEAVRAIDPATKLKSRRSAGATYPECETFLFMITAA